MPYVMISFNDTLTNEQLGPGYCLPLVLTDGCMFCYIIYRSKSNKVGVSLQGKGTWVK